MFGRKKKQPIKKSKISANLQVMPETFYGAQDPVLHYGGETSKPLAKTKATGRSNLALGKIVDFFKKKIVLYILLGVVFIIIIMLISWYYINEARQSLEPAPVKPVVEEILPEPVTEEFIEEKEIEAAPTSTEPITEPIIEEPQSLQERELEFPRILQTNSPDVDNDALTDLEEEIFNTDSGTWDTDGDGYYDGQEVFNLYNPAGQAPVKLIDSGLVAEYVNPSWQYRVYYPITWQVGEVDSQANQVLFSSVTGDFIEISAFIKNSQETFTDWFSRKASGQKFTDLQVLNNRFKEEGQKRKDDLTAYFVQGNNVYVLIYHPGTTGFVPFRHIMQMMQQSFRQSKTLIEIPEQVLLPAPPNFTEPIATTTFTEEAEI